MGMFSAIINPVADYFADIEKSKQSNKVASVMAANLAGQQAVDARNKARRDTFAGDTSYRASLIASQRGGLMSTILNLGGAAGDPNKPVGAGVTYGVGTEAALTEAGKTASEFESSLEVFKPAPIPKKKKSFLWKQSYDFSK